MRRRDVLVLFGGAIVTRSSRTLAQSSVVPSIGFLNSTSLASYAHLVAAFRRGLGEAGYEEGRNLTIEYRWAENQYDRLPELAADLVQRKVAVIAATGGSVSALAAKAATTTIPIVSISDDPVASGLVASLRRPGGNVTGVSLVTAAMTAKRLERLRELVPTATTIGFLVQRNNVVAEPDIKKTREAARAMGLRLVVLRCAVASDLDAALATMAEERIGALLIQSDPWFFSHRDRLVALATRHAVPTIYGRREFVNAGGLISYGASLSDVYREVGGYVGKILNGAKPSDLPVQHPTRFELVVNRKTAEALGIEIPPKLLALADEVIE